MNDASVSQLLTSIAVIIAAVSGLIAQLRKVDQWMVARRIQAANSAKADTNAKGSNIRAGRLAAELGWALAPPVAAVAWAWAAAGSLPAAAVLLPCRAR